MKTIIVSWKKAISATVREKIKQRFNITGITVNKESRLTLKEEDMEDFRETVRKGYITPVNKVLLHPREKRNAQREYPKE